MAIIRGVEALEEKRMDYQIPLDGCDELTVLAENINELSMSQRELAQKKQEMQEEREAWIRSMSHDIRTPLTSILSYTEFLEGKGELGQQEIKAYLSLVQSRAEQIRELTDRLLGKKPWEAGKGAEYEAADGAAGCRMGGASGRPGSLFH